MSSGRAGSFRGEIRFPHDLPADGGEASPSVAARRLPVVVFAVAGAVHVFVWASTGFRPVPIYPLAAALRAAGRLESVRVPDFSPFYFHLHLLVARTGLAGTPFLHGIEILAACLTAALFARLCVEFFPARIAAAGSVLFLLGPAPVILPHLLLPEVWRGLFDVGALLAFVLYRRTRALRFAVVSALLLGLSATTRPTALALAAALAAALLLSEGRRALRASAVLVAGPALFLLAVGLRDAALSGTGDPTAMDPGAVFYLGNNPASRGTPADSALLKQMEADVPGQPDYVHVLYKRFPAAALGHSVAAGDASRYWSDKALAFLRRHPERALELAWEKLVLLCRGWEPHDSIPELELERRVRSARLPLVPFSALVALAVVGLRVRRSDRDALELLVAGGVCAASILPFYVTTRMRAPLVPFAAFFACAGLTALGRAARSRAWGALAGGAVAALGVFAALSLPSRLEATLRHASTAQYAASVLRAEAADLRNRGARTDAAAVVARAVATAPFSAEEMTLSNVPYPAGGPVAASLEAARREVAAGGATRDRLFDLGILFYEGRDLDAARDAFDALGPDGRFDRGGRCAPSPGFYLARIAELSGRGKPDAERLFRAALRAAPGDATTLAHLSVLLEETGRPREAATLREELFAERPDVDAAFALGQAFLERGRAADAAFWLGRVAQWLPDFRRARLYAAAASFRAGDVPAGIAHAEAAFSLREDPAALEAFILPGYEEAARIEPGSAAARFRLGRALRRYGRFTAARETLSEALALDPSFEPARREVALLDRAAPRPR